MWHGFKSGSSEEPLAGILKKKKVHNKSVDVGQLCAQ
jgi:hypothetical protein